MYEAERFDFEVINEGFKDAVNLAQKSVRYHVLPL